MNLLWDRGHSISQLVGLYQAFFLAAEVLDFTVHIFRSSLSVWARQVDWRYLLHSETTLVTWWGEEMVIDGHII